MRKGDVQTLFRPRWFESDMQGHQSEVVNAVNPATGEKLATYRMISEEEAAGMAKKARTAFERWRLSSVEERGDQLRKLAGSLRAKKNEYAKMMTLEMGKPILQSESEIDKCAWTAEYFADNIGVWLSEERVKTDSKSSYVEFDPLGVILSVMPWNYPFWQVLRFAIPALAAGNTSILRHSNACPGSALAVEDAFRNAGFPDGVFTTAITDHETVAKLIASKDVAGVSLTGSTDAGRRIGELAARNFKKVVLELGGSDPYIVLEDANVKEAAKVGANARLQNSGQSCIAAKRFIVVNSVSKEFTEEFVSEFEKKVTGDPIDRRTDVGPVVNVAAAQTLDQQVKASVSNGGRVRTGGKRLAGKGAFYEPTVMDDVTLDMKVMKEEVFGPVAPVYIAQDESEAIRVANATAFGLGSSLWTTDMDKARRLATEIESGMVFVNAMTKSDPRMPFGGIKESGLGRELSVFGLREFVNVKSVNLY